MKTVPMLAAAALIAAGLTSTAQANPAFYLSGLSPLVQKVGCWDECEEFLEAVEEAREEASEARAEAREAAEDATEEYAEELEEYGYRPRRTHRQAHAQARTMQKPEAETAPESKSAKENKAPAKTKNVAVNAPATCKQYSPATGMLLSVPCE
jgi:hypothetical protein